MKRHKDKNMFDMLEGLDYKRNECSLYVAKILNNVQESIKNGDIIYKNREDVKIGDVCVDDFSSHLITRPYDQFRNTNKKEKEQLMVITKEKLDDLRQKRNLV